MEQVKERILEMENKAEILQKSGKYLESLDVYEELLDLK
jgi:hypothetical protein